MHWVSKQKGEEKDRGRKDNAKDKKIEIIILSKTYHQKFNVA